MEGRGGAKEIFAPPPGHPLCFEPSPKPQQSSSTQTVTSGGAIPMQRQVSRPQIAPVHPIAAVRVCRPDALLSLCFKEAGRPFPPSRSLGPRTISNPLGRRRWNKNTNTRNAATMGFCMSKPEFTSVQSNQANKPPHPSPASRPAAPSRPTPASPKSAFPKSTSLKSAAPARPPASVPAKVTARLPAPAKTPTPEVTTRLPASRIERRFLLAFLRKTFPKEAWKISLRNDWYTIVAPRSLTPVSIAGEERGLALASHVLNADLALCRRRSASSSAATPTDLATRRLPRSRWACGLAAKRSLHAFVAA
jgi:hypothetical protein